MVDSRVATIMSYPTSAIKNSPEILKTKLKINEKRNPIYPYACIFAEHGVMAPIYPCMVAKPVEALEMQSSVIQFSTN